MKRPKYHFLIVSETKRGKFILTLPKQTMGRIPVCPNIIVRDVMGKTTLCRMKKKSKDGDSLFTTTLRGGMPTYTASDIYPLENNSEVISSCVSFINATIKS